LASANLTYGIFQCINNHGDLQFIHSHGALTFTNPDIYRLEKNEFGIRYPINSFIIMSPIFGFYYLGDKVVYYYLFFLIASISTIPYLLLSTAKQGSALRTESYLVILALLLSTAALRITLNTGQIGIILFTFFLISYKIHQKHFLLSSLALAIAISKPHLGLFFLLFMFLNGYIKLTLLSIGYHAFVFASYCILNNLNIITMVTRWVKWQSQFNDIALSSSHYLSNSFHSIDIFNISRVYDFPQAAILIFFISAVIIGILSLYRYRDLPAVQLGILCVLPLFLFYHRPYDYFLVWGLIPLLLLSQNSKMVTIGKIVIISSMLLPYFPTMSFLRSSLNLRYLFHLIYVGLFVLNILVILFLSESCRKKEILNQ
jgi:hypothetical protein